MKTILDFNYIDPSNKLEVKTIPAGTSVDAKHPQYARMKASGYFENAPKKTKSKKKMINPDAE